MAMVTMLFIAEQRVAHQQSLALLTPRDIVEMLKETLPHKLQGRRWSPGSTSVTRADAAPSSLASARNAKWRHLEQESLPTW